MMLFVRRYAFVMVWIGVVIGLAVGIALWVDSSSGAVHTVITFEPFHVVGHLALYGILAGVLAVVAEQRVALATIVFILVAVAQEWAQAFAVGRSFSADSVYDIGVDCLGGAIGLAVMLALASRTSRAHPSARKQRAPR